MLVRGERNGETPTLQRDRGDAPLMFTDAMRKLAGGVVVLTALAGSDTLAMTATSVCSVSAEPPSLLACVNSRATIQCALSLGASFGVNVLDETDVEIARDCAGRAPQHMRVSASAWQFKNAPLLRRALATFECRVAARIEQGSHVIVIGEVLEWSVAMSGRPLLYFDRAYRTLSDR